MKIFHGQQTLFTIRTTGQWMISITKAVAKHRDAPSCETKKFLPGGMLWFSLGQILICDIRSGSTDSWTIVKINRNQQYLRSRLLYHRYPWKKLLGSRRSCWNSDRGSLIKLLNHFYHPWVSLTFAVWNTRFIPCLFRCSRKSDFSISTSSPAMHSGHSKYF